MAKTPSIMPHYLPEPSWPNGAPGKIGILLINLGTPDAPTRQALRRYLKEFLSDPRIVEMPRPVWWLLLNGIILNIRPQKSAAKYAQIWSNEGSPLLLHTRRQATLLQSYLGERIKAPLAIEFAMRYGTPSIANALAQLKAQQCDRILAFPLYPQYAASSSASAFDALFQALMRMRTMPGLRTIRSYHDHPAYIAALAQSVRDHWMQHGRPDKLLMSFHGVPRSTVDKGDPYQSQCRETGGLLADALELGSQQYAISFQSRFGRSEWLKPHTLHTLHEFGRQGVTRVDVICPGFASDCLETLEEIGMEGKAAFLGNGGKEFHYIRALNERDDWIKALCAIVLDNLQGWLGGVSPPSDSAPQAAPPRT